MRPTQAITTCFRKSLQFSGRASRSEYWWFMPVGVMLPFGALWLAATVVPDATTLALGSIFFLTLLPLMAVTKRRLNDSGRPSTWFETPLMALIFFLAALWAAVSLSGWAYAAWGNGADGPSGFGVMLCWVFGNAILIPMIAYQFFTGLISGSMLFSQMVAPSVSPINSNSPTKSEGKS